MDELIARTAEQIFHREAGPAAVKEMLRGAGSGRLWQALEDAGLPDAMRADTDGGSGLALAELHPVLLALGRHGAPLPLGETILLRAFLGEAAPPGRIAIAGQTRADAGGIASRWIVHGRHADWVVADLGAGSALLPVAGASEVIASPGGLGSDADMRWPPGCAGTVPLASGGDWRAAGALVAAVRMAGALDRALEITVRHANDRQQFGRPVGRFQAVQQQLSVLAEQAAAARTASELACVAGGDRLFDPIRAAMAKVRVGEAAIAGAAISHAIHGAIGVTEEHELHLCTGLLQHGRLSFGGEQYWAAVVGRAMLDGPSGGALDFVRSALSSQEQ